MALTIFQALHAFEESRPKPEPAADSIAAETVWEMLKVATEKLMSEVATVKHELHSTYATDRKDFERLVEQCAVHLWLSKSYDGMLARAPHREEEGGGPKPCFS